ncbi:helix-turn-helix transcriptional regulator [Sphingobium nicotianae]|nr:AraC family transcriptional regulator [Sphingobium nicotianae]
MISTTISEIFATRWNAQQIGNVDAEAKIILSTAADVSLSHARMSPMHLDSRADQHPGDLKYSIYMSDQPSLVTVSNRAPMLIQPRELFVLRSDISCHVETRRSYTTIGLVVPQDLLHQFVPHCERFVAQRLGSSFGLHDLLANSLDSLVAMSEAGRFEVLGPRFARTFLELLSVLTAETLEDDRMQRSTSLDIRRAQVKSYIDRNFRDADLTITEIAKRLHLSARYLQLAFQNDDVTPSEYLRKRRIEASARELGDKRSGRRNITEIAFGNGFNSSSHFSTEFKRTFGMSPREWRHSRFEQGDEEIPEQLHS